MRRDRRGARRYDRRMPASDTLLAFALASLAVLAFPGPAVTYIVARSVRHGRRAGLVSTFGIETGILVQVIAATAGLSAVLASSATAFTVVKYAGAAYLVVLGLRALFGGGDAAAERPADAKLFRDGLVIAVLNPKTALFFLAFLPQFVDPARGAASVQIALLGVIFVAIACVTDGTYALLAGTAGGRLRRRLRTHSRALGRSTGGVYIGLGVLAAVSGDRPSK
jgi:threonine/homoserine/homoserine lactone efflux protein